MKKFIPIALLFPFFVFKQSIQAKSNNLKVVVENLQIEKGMLLITLHNKKTFLSNSSYIRKKIKPKIGKNIFSFDQLPPGEYAIKVLHDINNNRKMDFSIFGLPKEKYAVSGKKNRFGPPKFESMKFFLEKDTLVRLRL